jgi:Ser/Thr protein kinase RdoA (MazF antagonist)
VPVAEPLPSRSGAWTEVEAKVEAEVEAEVQAGGGAEETGAPPYVGVAFRRAPGRVTGPGDWTDARVEAWGELLGRLHAHARAWTGPVPRRPRWREQSYLGCAEEAMGDDAPFLSAVEELRERAAALPHDAPGAGPIHADLHHGNLLLDGESWTAIDFDDAVVGPYAFDVAMPLYYAVEARLAAARGDGACAEDARAEAARDAAAERFLGPFLTGFRRHAPDPEGGAEAVATSLAVRQAELAIVLRVKLDPARWTERQARVAAALRDGVVAGRAIVPAATLSRHLG